MGLDGCPSLYLDLGSLPVAFHLRPEAPDFLAHFLHCRQLDKLCVLESLSLAGDIWRECEVLADHLDCTRDCFQHFLCRTLRLPEQRLGFDENPIQPRRIKLNEYDRRCFLFGLFGVFHCF